MKKQARNRLAFATMDALMAISIISLGMIGYYYMKQDEERASTVNERKLFLQQTDIASRQTFLDIIEAYSPKLGAENGVVKDTDTRWGWSKSNGTSPFPISSTVSGITYLRYELQSGILSATAFADLRKKIANNYREVCSDLSARVGSVSSVYLYCPLFNGISYDVSSGATGLVSPFVKGGTIDPEVIPTLRISYKKYDSLKSTFTIEEYRVPFTSEYLSRQNDTSRKMIDIRNVLETYANSTKLREIANVESIDGSGGLNNADDEFVGWHWKSFGDNRASMDATYCNKAVGGGQCTNLNTNNVWRSGLNIRKGLIARRVANNFFGGDMGNLVDGFGNAIYIHPTSSDCSAVANIYTCQINSLAIPQDNYITTGTPPYVTAIYIEPFGLKTRSSKPYGKTYIVY